MVTVIADAGDMDHDESCDGDDDDDDDGGGDGLDYDTIGEGPCALNSCISHDKPYTYTLSPQRIPNPTSPTLKPSTLQLNIGALVIRIGLWGVLYEKYSKEPSLYYEAPESLKARLFQVEQRQ